MKITFVINTLEVGGAAKMLKYVANITADLFDSVSIITMYDDVGDASGLNSKVDVICLGLGRLSRIKARLRMIQELREVLDKENPDYVCAFIGHVNVIARIATMGREHLKFISAERGDPYTQSFFWKTVTRWTYRNSDYCFFQLDGARDFFDKKTRKKSFVIPNPYIPEEHCLLYDEQRNKTIISAGRFSPEKRFDLLISSFAEIVKDYPDYKLIICGEGPLSKKYVSQAQKLGIEDKVVFPGYVKSVSEAVRKEGIFVLSSFFEGIPNSLIEAMSVGIPCIATDCTPGGPRFLTDNGKRGILIPVNSVMSLTRALRYLIENPEIAAEYGKRGAEVVNILNEETIRKKWIEAFCYIIQSR